MAINKAFFEGYVLDTKDSEKAFSFNLRAVETWDSGERETVVRFVCFSKLLDKARAEIKKGKPIFVEGRLTSRRREGNDGVFYNLEAVCERFIVIDDSKPTAEPTKPLDKAKEKDDNIPF